MDNNHKTLIDQIQKSMDVLMKKNNQLMSSIPAEEQHKVVNISKDINAALNAAKEGDSDLINKLTKKYASYNNF